MTDRIAPVRNISAPCAHRSPLCAGKNISRTGKILARAALFWLCLIVLAMFDGFTGRALAELAPPVDISVSMTRDILFKGHIASFQDPEQTKTLSDIRALPEEAFTREKGIPAFGYTNNAIWYRIDLVVGHATDDTRHIDIGPIYLNVINLYVVQKDNPHPIWTTLMGDHVPSSQRPVIAPEHLAPFPALEPGHYSLYIRTQSNSTQFIEVSLLSNDAQISRWSLGLAGKGLFVGIVLSMALMYMIVGLFIRDYAVALYGCCLAAFGTLSSALGGLFLTVFAPEWPYANDLLVGMGTAVNIAAASLLWVNILNIGAECRLCKKIFCTYSGVVLLGSVTATTPLYTTFASYCQFSHSAVMTIYICFLVRRIIRNPRFITHWIYFIVMLVPTVSLIIFYLALNHYLPVNAITAAAYPFALASHLVLMSVLMAMRISGIDRDRIKAASMAESTEKIVQEQRKLVSMLSHEFRTPLAVIQRAAEMVTLRLQKEAATAGNADVPRAVTERLKRIQDQSGKLARLVDVFLGKDNLNAPQFALARKLVPAKNFLQEFATLARRDNAHINFSYLGDANAVLYADETLLGLAMTNVIENARRHQPGETISLTAREENGMILKIDISHPQLDQADPADIDKVRERLFRPLHTVPPETGPNRFYAKKTNAEDFTPRNNDGLGLHITQRIITAHGGKTDIVSRQETGMDIRITLPLEPKL
ncbi:sensor histidine kinase [Thalassospira mesophila]|uniref:histidine kinase n=1 Tax=Thalassospira mesophila TaxID=1293891 RepID=A0A1Y2L382_9PROT|nr:sensor histidine kinase [Thalassospira mesophila]OSQ38763.1 hypothetical protein TMES_08170 [Thalassospira mesophila]